MQNGNREKYTTADGKLFAECFTVAERFTLSHLALNFSAGQTFHWAYADFGNRWAELGLAMPETTVTKGSKNVPDQFRQFRRWYEKKCSDIIISHPARLIPFRQQAEELEVRLWITNATARAVHRQRIVEIHGGKDPALAANVIHQQEQAGTAAISTQDPVCEFLHELRAMRTERENARKPGANKRKAV